MHYGNIKYYDVANGEGVRTSLFVSGCRNNCPGCFQPETQDFLYGKEFTDKTANEILKSLDNKNIQGLSLLGGEPFEKENQKVLVCLLRKMKEMYPEKDVWAWTGYVLDKDLIAGGKRHYKTTDEMLSYIDVLVDGPFLLSQKNLNLFFRGSENQRVIDLKKTLSAKEVVLFHA